MRFLRSTYAFVCVAALGCVASEENQVDTASQSLIAANRIAVNRIAVNRIAVNGGSDDLFETEGGREVFKYIVECAIPEGITLFATDSQGVTYDFPGAIGLAPRWLERPLNERDSRWVSACLFSRVNAHGVSVQISLRGPSSALDISDEERAQWTLEEGAFYGQYFLPESEPIQWYACSGRNLQGAHEHLRDCANPDPEHPGLTYCGFTYMGECGDFVAPPSPHACKNQSATGTYYRECTTGSADSDDSGDNDDRDDDRDDDDDDGDHGDDGHHGDRDGQYHEVITTFIHS